jgi:hypothetical protein
MIDRNKVVVGILAALAIASAIGFGIMFSRIGDSCMNGNDTASCPVLADVDGIRFYVGGPQELINTEGALTPHSTITRTNSPTHFRSKTTYALAGIDPRVLQVAEAAPDSNEPGQYRLLHPLNMDAAYPGLCQYFTPADRSIIEECGGVTPT